jgi:hypothetical protein
MDLPMLAVCVSEVQGHYARIEDILNATFVSTKPVNPSSGKAAHSALSKTPSQTQSGCSSTDGSKLNSPEPSRSDPQFWSEDRMQQLQRAKRNIESFKNNWLQTFGKRV